MAIDRIANLVTPFPDIEGNPALLFARLRGWDGVSQCFRYEIEALSVSSDLSPDDILGQSVVVDVTTIEEAPEVARTFEGIVDEFSYEGVDDDGWVRYRLVLRPLLWMLSKTTDNRIFQNMSVPDIIQQILDEHGQSNYRVDLSGSYDPREYCVQYGETDLDFLQRLMEHEAMFYFFDFANLEHELVICDSEQQLATIENCSPLRFEADIRPGLEGFGVITKLERRDSVVTGKHTLTDYDFESPSADLLVSTDLNMGYPQGDHENYDYPGKYTQTARGQDLADIRIEEDQALRCQIWANSTCSLLFSGKLFTLEDYPREVENQEYMILAATYEVLDAQYSAGPVDGEEQGFTGRYRMVPSASGFRPARVTPKPVMKGPQTAIVVGPGGEEIYTDQYSRVKVQFYWDREGTRDENSTCWIRVSSAWAGSGWGFIQIPRIGQEVIVDFLDGDPDRPIITGRVYNAEQMPPYDLPGNATQSGWKSNSSPGGGGWNELRFEDKTGSEEVYFQAEKDHNELVKNNETRNIGNDWVENVGHDATQDVGNDRDETVGNNKTTQVAVDRTVSIGNNDTETVGSNRSLTVGIDETIAVGANSTKTIGANHSQTVGANQTVTVTAVRTDTVGAAEIRTVGAAQTNTIGAVRSVSVGAAQSHDIGAVDSWEIGSNQTIKIGGGQDVEIAKVQNVKVGEDMTEAVGKNKSATVAENYDLEVGKEISIKAGDQITLVCGKAKFQMKKDGTIVIEGKDISIKGSGKIVAEASGAMTLKGSKIDMN